MSDAVVVGEAYHFIDLSLGFWRLLLEMCLESASSILHSHAS